jgi:hypothetical protein
MSSATTENSDSETALSVIGAIRSFLDADQMRYHQISEEALELYMQGNNLTMHVVIYVHNSHLILRVPAFIRNVDLRRMDILLFIMQVTGEILDIRFEIGKDGRTLSACCQHILEDASVTSRQFDLAMMVLMHIVDDTYPRFMQLIYGKDSAQKDEEAVKDSSAADQQADESADEPEDADEFAPVVDDEDPRKIN